MMPGIRAATANDLDAICGIERASFGDPWSRKSFADSLSHAFVRVHVLEEDDQLMGYAVVWVSGDECELANLAIDPARRRAGLGARLLEAVLQQARDEGLLVMFLEVRDSNTAARHLYEAHQFHEVGRRPRYYANPVEDALVLRRDL